MLVNFVFVEAMKILETEGLKKVFGYRVLFEGVNLTLESGKMYCFFGANGAGKTTLLSCLAMPNSLTDGQILYKGQNPNRFPQEYRSGLFLIDQNFYLYEDFSMEENLTFFTELHSEKIHKNNLEKICREFGLEKFLSFPVKNFSSGMKRKVRLALLSYLSPNLILLDEPFNNLDFQTEQKLWRLLQEKTEKGAAVLMVTHQPDRCFKEINGGWFALSEKRVLYTPASEFKTPEALETHLKHLEFA